MSAIDQYKHELIDFFDCPSDYEFVHGSNTRQIGIYRLLESIPKNEKNFNGVKGDILVGGGSGEAKSMRISQKGVSFFLEEAFDDFKSNDDLIQSFWTSSFAFKIGNGFLKLGWNPEAEDMEFWFAEKIINQLLKKEKLNASPNIKTPKI